VINRRPLTAPCNRLSDGYNKCYNRYIVGKDRNQNRIIDKDNSVRTLYRTCTDVLRMQKSS